MRVNELYSLNDLISHGLVEYPVKEVNTKVYLNGSKVYFFELVDNQRSYRLYSVINKRSFFL